jgi:hypothetical protein
LFNPGISIYALSRHCCGRRIFLMTVESELEDEFDRCCDEGEEILTRFFGRKREFKWTRAEAKRTSKIATMIKCVLMDKIPDGLADLVLAGAHRTHSFEAAMISKPQFISYFDAINPMIVRRCKSKV